MKTPYDGLNGSVSVNGLSPSAIYRQGYEAGKRDQLQLLQEQAEAFRAELHQIIVDSDDRLKRAVEQAGKESDKYWPDILKTESEAAHPNLAAERG